MNHHTIKVEEAINIKIGFVVNSDIRKDIDGPKGNVYAEELASDSELIANMNLLPNTF